MRVCEKNPAEAAVPGNISASEGKQKRNKPDQEVHDFGSKNGHHWLESVVGFAVEFFVVVCP